MREERRPENKARTVPPDRGGADMVVVIDTNHEASEWMDRGRWSYGTVTGRAEARGFSWIIGWRTSPMAFRLGRRESFVRLVS